MENKTFEFVTFAILIESLITYISQFFIQESFCWQMALSLILGIIIAVAYKLDLPAHFNLKSEIPYIIAGSNGCKKFVQLRIDCNKQIT